MAAHSASERRRIARLGGMCAAAQGKADPRKAWAARWSKYLDRADGMADGHPLNDAQRAALARELMRADMIRLGRLAADAKAARRQARVEANRRAADRALRQADDQGPEP